MNRALLLFIFLACMAASAVSGAWLLGCILVDSSRAWSLILAYDQVLNAASGGNSRETLSSRAGRALLVKRRWGCVLCKLLDVLDPNHCLKNILEEYLTPTERAAYDNLPH